MSETDLETIGRKVTVGEEYYAIQGVTLLRALDAIHRAPISLGYVSRGFRASDCQWKQGGECGGCRSDSLRQKPTLLGPRSIVINPLSGAALDLHTPILESISRFLRGVYGPYHKPEEWHRRNAERYLLVESLEPSPLSELEQPKGATR